MNPLQKAIRYLAFPAGVAATSFAYTTLHNNAKKKLPFLEKVEPFTPAGEGAFLTGTISFVTNALFSARAPKLCATILSICGAALVLRKIEEKEAQERYRRSHRDDF